jgi:hypothetical protein
MAFAADNVALESLQRSTQIIAEESAGPVLKPLSERLAVDQ